MRLAHYLNQFFGGLGGENAADTPVLGRRGAVGPGIGLQHALGDRGEVVLTIVGGDTYVAEHEAEAALAIADCLREAQVDVLVAGPAFNAGRYGLACALACLTTRPSRRIDAACTSCQQPRPRLTCGARWRPSPSSL